ncbi:MAG: YqeG family HAD IIIA-type phosphatase [Lachnospiraceae bacterium]|nr:YqeG family HAD IIIA-type phosphatase [Lachnospiraceae bacterium]
MFKNLYPRECADSVYTIDYETLYREGYRGLIYDIDNTLVPDNAPADKPSAHLIGRLKGMGFSCLILSNNDLERVRSFSDAVGAEYIYKAAKPSVRGYEEAMEKLGTDRNTTLFIGDQLFTDIWGANRAGIRNILVRPIDKRERTHIIFKRILERFVMVFYRMNTRDTAGRK